jgi:hypothetical protein
MKKSVLLNLIKKSEIVEISLEDNNANGSFTGIRHINSTGNSPMKKNKKVFEKFKGGKTNDT